ncbi:MAG TPA: DUF1801 domain-containing protein [Gemmatimonadaceae bacterium]|jgi:hypothetical protein
MRSTATTPEEYLAQQPADRRTALATVRAVILQNLPNGYEESIGAGMLVYGVPTAHFAMPNKQALWYVALAAQKNYNSLYLMSVYADKDHQRRLRAAFAESGRKLDMGKSCVHFRAADDLPLDVIGELIASVSAEKWIAIFQASRRKPAKRTNA